MNLVHLNKKIAKKLLSEYTLSKGQGIFILLKLKEIRMVQSFVLVIHDTLATVKSIQDVEDPLLF